MVLSMSIGVLKTDCKPSMPVVVEPAQAQEVKAITTQDKAVKAAELIAANAGKTPEFIEGLKMGIKAAAPELTPVLDNKPVIKPVSKQPDAVPLPAAGRIIIGCEDFFKVLKGLELFMDEIPITIDKTGLHLCGMDASQIALLDYVYPAKSCEVYQVDKEYKYNLDLVALNQKLSALIHKDGKLELLIDGSDKAVLKSRNSKTTIHLGEPSSMPREPKIDFTVNYKVSPKYMKDWLKELEKMGNHIEINYNGDYLNLKTDSNGEFYDIKVNQEDLLSVYCKQAAKSTYAIDLLLRILKVIEIPSIFEFDFKTDAPCKISSMNNGRLTMYLAPRIETP